MQFIKMNGAGNDFVILDARREPIRLTPESVRRLAARTNSKTGGCDQLIVMERSSEADVFMRIFNADGGQVDACGNATRCVAGLMEDELQRLPVSIATNAGILHGLKKAYTPEEEEYILVDMGAPRLGWQEIPLAVPEGQAAALVTAAVGLDGPIFVSMGNPHVVFFLQFDPEGHENKGEDELFAVNLETLGPKLEKYTDVFPQGVNVTVATLRAASDGEGHIVHARVWERGAGLTQACGTAGCAMLAAAHGRDSFIRHAHIWFEPAGHVVTVQIGENGHILLGGPIEKEFTGNVEV